MEAVVLVDMFALVPDATQYCEDCFHDGEVRLQITDFVWQIHHLDFRGVIKYKDPS